MKCFNPRAREERDRGVDYADTTGNVSIHALVKSATVEPACPQCMDEVSIHALVKSATSLAKPQTLQPACSNPRAREERDGSNLITAIGKNVVSIHALVKSATNIPGRRGIIYSVSIHALVKSATSRLGDSAV